MGVTSVLKLPYPELNDAANVPVDMKELADRLEALLKNGQSLAGAAGSVNIVLTNQSVRQVSITFPAGRFTSAPAVTATVMNTSGWFAYTYSITTAGCNVGIRHYADTISNTTITVSWIARAKG